MTSNPIEESEPTWVSVHEATRFAGLGRSTILRACSNRGIPVHEDDRRRLVPLERVLAATTGKDVEALRRRLPGAMRYCGEMALAEEASQ